MKIRSSEIVVSAIRKEQYPAEGLPEIALVGRSNVGKSSATNALLNRRNFARTSQTPGKTRTINFYKINNEFYFVDLPGYGFSKMSKTEQVKVGQFIEEYLFKRDKISLIIFLIDIRHSPTSNDKLMYDYVIRSGKPFIILANKADKIAPTKVLDTVTSLQKEINPLMDATILPFSSEKKVFCDDVWKVIEEYI